MKTSLGSTRGTVNRSHGWMPRPVRPTRRRRLTTNLLLAKLDRTPTCVSKRLRPSPGRSCTPSHSHREMSRSLQGRIRISGCPSPPNWRRSRDLNARSGGRWRGALDSESLHAILAAIDIAARRMARTTDCRAVSGGRSRPLAPPRSCRPRCRTFRTSIRGSCPAPGARHEEARMRQLTLFAFEVSERTHWRR